MRSIFHRFFRFSLLALAFTRVLPAADFVIKPGEVVEFTAPLTPELRKLAGGGKPAANTEALAAVAVPADFTPDRAWPILLVSATSDPGLNSSRKLLERFTAPALAAGWIVIAADPAQPVEKADDTDGLRYALLMSALTRLQREWPQVARWPCAFGGFSGGAKRSAVLAGFSAMLGVQPIGLYQAGCNEATMRRVIKNIPDADQARFVAMPVFLSSGRDDRIAKPKAVEEVKAELKHLGFAKVKLARFTGGHEVNAPHIEEALRWFRDLAATAVGRGK